jgi:hypothetical protein
MDALSSLNMKSRVSINKDDFLKHGCTEFGWYKRIKAPAPVSYDAIVVVMVVTINDWIKLSQIHLHKINSRSGHVLVDEYMFSPYSHLTIS